MDTLRGSARAPTPVALIGCGRWGANILRVLSSHPLADVVAVVDPSPQALENAHRLAPSALLLPSLDTLPPQVSAAFIATPSPLHAQHANALIARGLHLFVEKPLAMSASCAAQLTASARAQDRVGMVGHIMLHHPAVRALLAFIKSEQAGTPRHLSAERVSPAAAAPPQDPPLWGLAPHDISVLRALDPSEVSSCRTAVEPFRTTVDLLLRSGLSAHITVGRSVHVKKRSLCVQCDRGTVLFDDVRATDKVAFLPTGSMLPTPIPYDATVEPLRAELEAFLLALREGVPVLTDFAHGADVVSLLAQAESQASMRPPPSMQVQR